MSDINAAVQINGDTIIIGKLLCRMSDGTVSIDCGCCRVSGVKIDTRRLRGVSLDHVGLVRLVPLCGTIG